MKLSRIAAALVAVLSFAGCEQASTAKTESASSKTLTITATSTTTPTYWDLDTGSQVTDANSTAWDVAFTSNLEGVLTNSGSSKVASAANGGVYYANDTDFSAVTSANASGFSGARATDAKYWVTGQSTTLQTLNAITYLDYTSGTGADDSNDVTLSATDTTNALVTSTTTSYGGSAYYHYNSSTHAVTVSREVYVIRHGDGTKYSKFQITALSGNTSSRVRTIQYQTF